MVKAVLKEPSWATTGYPDDAAGLGEALVVRHIHRVAFSAQAGVFQAARTSRVVPVSVDPVAVGLVRVRFVSELAGVVQPAMSRRPSLAWREG